LNEEKKSRVALGIWIGLSTIFATSNALMTTFAQFAKNADFNHECYNYICIVKITHWFYNLSS